MKRPFHILAALLAGVLMLTGCQSSTQKTAEPVARVKIADLLPEKSVPPSGSKKKKFDQVSFDMPLKWREQNTGTNTAYIDDDTHCAYMYCGCSNDKWLTPEEILAQYLEKTEGSPVTVQELSKKKNVKPASYIKPMLKNHKKEVIEVLARLDRKTVEEYSENLSLLTLPMQILELINDPEVQSLFHSQGESKVTSLASSSPATENTEAEGI